MQRLEHYACIDEAWSGASTQIMSIASDMHEYNKVYDISDILYATQQQQRRRRHTVWGVTKLNDTNDYY